MDLLGNRDAGADPIGYVQSLSLRQREFYRHTGTNSESHVLAVAFRVCLAHGDAGCHQVANLQPHVVAQRVVVGDASGNPQCELQPFVHDHAAANSFRVL